MDIKGTFCSIGSSISTVASSCGSTIKHYGDLAVEKGKMGYNKTVTLVRDNPRTTAVSVVAAFAFAVGAWYFLGSGKSADAPPPPPTPNSDTPPPPPPTPPTND